MIEPYYQRGGVTLYCGDVLEVLRDLPDDLVQTVVTSPPYWALRDYGVDGQLGLEKTPQEYIVNMTAVFNEVRRVLRIDGIAWVNIGDTYNSPNTHSGKADKVDWGIQRILDAKANVKGTTKELKPKDLCMIPARLAIALQDDGWWLRSEIIWNKPNPMPSSVKDRPTTAHEYIYLIARSSRYFYDAEAIREPASEALIRQVMDGYNGDSIKDFGGSGAQNASDVKKRIIANARARVRTDKQRGHSRQHAGFNDRWDSMTYAEQCALGANKRTVWTIATQPFKEAHFATFPEKLVEPCILAGSRQNDYVMDPFSGSGTTGVVALRYGRRYIGIDLNKEYLDMSIRRLEPLLNQGTLNLEVA